MLVAKVPGVAGMVQTQLEEGVSCDCLRELVECKQQLVDAGAQKLPSWDEAFGGARAPSDECDFDAGEWRRGWQYHTSSALETCFLERVVRPASDAARCALLRSQAGPSAARWLTAVPCKREFSLSPIRMQVALRRRLRWPLPGAPSKCNGLHCRGCMDRLGDHWASCNRSGKLLRRSRPIERTWARVFREAKARVKENVLLRDTLLPGIAAHDGRKLEIIATGLPLFNGVPLGVDASIVSPLHADGTVWLGADMKNGVAISRAEADKAATYPELIDSDELRLVTVACETGGRWSQTCVDLLRQLAKSRARDAPERLQLSARVGWETRWWTMLSVCVQDALAATLVEDAAEVLDGVDGAMPELGEVLVDCGGCV